MERHFELNDLEFETQFANGSMSPEIFTHEAHLRLAWIHITKYGITKAIDNVCSQIQAFANTHGAADKYHTTVTVASVRAVYHFVLKSQSSTFKDFILEFPKLKNSFKKLLESHYKSDIFNSELAKQAFVEPDLAPFDEIN